MEYNVVELVISSGFWFLVGFVIAKARPKDLMREALYKANPELRPAMVFTVNDKLEILWYRYEGNGSSFLATVIEEENAETLADWYKLPTPKVGDFLMTVDSQHHLVSPEVFHKTYKRVLSVSK